MTHTQKMKAVVEAAGECWHKGLHPIYKSICEKCGEAFTSISQKTNPSPNDLNELFRLSEEAISIHAITFSYEERICCTLYGNIDIRTVEISQSGDTLGEALLNALYASLEVRP